MRNWKEARYVELDMWNYVEIWATKVHYSVMFVIEIKQIGIAIVQWKKVKEYLLYFDYMHKGMLDLYM